MNKHFNEWISKIDMLTHQLGVFYKSIFEAELMPDELKTLSALELGILNLLDWEPNSYVKNVIKLLNIPNSTLTSAINRLEKKKIVSRSIYPEDKRSFKLILLDKGKILLKKWVEYKKVLFEIPLLALDNDEEREMLILLLEKIAGKIKDNKNIKEKK